MDLWILTFQTKRIRCVWGKTAFSGIQRSCVKVFRSKFKASGVSPPPKFLIWWKSVKIPLKFGQYLCKFGQNVWKPSQNRFLCFDFTKMAPEIKVQTFLFLDVIFPQFFFGQVRGNLGKFGGNLDKNGAWSALIWKKCALNGMKCSHYLRWFSLEFFSGKFREIWAKYFAPPKICLLLLLWKSMGFQGLHWLQKVGSEIGRASCRERV